MSSDTNLLIRDAGSYFGVASVRALLPSYRKWVKSEGGWDPRVIRDPDDIAVSAAPAVAYCNHARWVAECPLGDGGATLVMTGQPFLCPVCANVDLGHRWRPVVFPPAHAAICVELAKRPRRERANWVPGETVPDLVAERLAHTQERA
jgi:hypothetical protein